MRINDGFKPRSVATQPVTPRQVQQPKADKKPDISVSTFESGPVLPSKQPKNPREVFEERAAERILDNEALGDDKTDAEYKPMLASAMRRIHDYAMSVADPTSPEAQAGMDALIKQLSRELKMPYAEWSARSQAELLGAERLLENEALRGNLTDDQYGPLLDKALARIHDVAFSLPNPGTPEYKEALDEAVTQIARELKVECREFPARSRAELLGAERLLDNEALRGDLTDDQYGPLLDKALARVHDAAFSLPNPGTPEYEQALDEAVTQIARELKAECRALAAAQ